MVGRRDLERENETSNLLQQPRGVATPVDILAEVRHFKLRLLADLLAECTDSQRELFSKIYPDPSKEKDLMPALQLLARTVNKNREKSV